MIHTVKGFGVVSEAAVDIFLEFPCFLSNSAYVGNLISGSSAFPESNLYIWKFSVHVLMKPSLKDFEHNHASMWNEGKCLVVWTFFAIAFFGVLECKLTFSSPIATAVFQICQHIECSTFTASSFRIWNSSAGIPSPHYFVRSDAS